MGTCKNTSTAYVFSNYINAWSLQRGLAQLGVELHCLSSELGLLRRQSDVPEPNSMLLFTDERSLKRYWSREEFCFYPQVHNTCFALDDKLLFSEWLAQNGESPVPFKRELPSIVSWPLVVKARHSWLGERKLPRGYYCQNSQDLRRAVKSIKHQSLQEGHFFLQQFIVGSANVYSTCGFYDFQDNNRNAIIVTCKTLSTESSLGTGAIVKTVVDPGGLVARTKRILDQLKFHGPFELEFLQDKDGRCYILELNPRFWMQHGLFVDAFDNLVLKLYVNHDDVSQHSNREEILSRQAVWLNRCYLVNCLARGKVKSALQFIGAINSAKRSNAKICWYPSWPTTLRYFGFQSFTKISRGLRRLMKNAATQHEHPELGLAGPPKTSV